METIRHTYFIAILLGLFSVPVFSQSVLINEIVYANKGILQDADGDTPDWIELFNNSEKTINLEGYQLTDDTTKTEFWTLPKYDLKAGEYLVIFASKKNKRTGSEFHTDFRLSLLKDPLFLLNATQEIIDRVDVQCVPANISLGCKPDGSTNRVILTPSPGKSNNSSENITVNYVKDTLIVSHQSGFYTEKLNLELSNEKLNNQIFYTLNGDVPDEDAHQYKDTKIELKDLTPGKNRFANVPETFKEPGHKIFKANIIRARVYSNGCPASNEVSNIYFINEKIKNQYKVPIISIITEEKNLFDKEIGIYTNGNHNNFNQRGKAWERPVHVEIFDENKEQIIDQDAGIRISGQGSRSAPQKPLRLYARKEYDKASFNYPFFPQKPEISEFETLLLRSTRGLSGTLFKDELTQSLVQDMNFDYSGAQTVITFINGEYWGIYSLRERLDKGYVKNNFKVENAQLDIIRHGLSEIKLEEGSMDNYNRLLDFFSTMNPESDNFYTEVNELIDIPHLIDYYIAQMYYANYDFPHNNVKTWRLLDNGSKWRFYFFDCDACMINVKQDQLAEYSSDINDLQIHVEWSTLIFKALLQNKAFREDFSKAFYYHIYNTFSPEKVLSEIERYEKIYEPLVGEHTYRWHQPEDFTKWKNNVDMLKVFAMQRPNSQVKQLTENFGGPFKIFPNPSNGLFNIQTKSDPMQEVQVQITSLSGKLIYSEIYKTSSELIEINPPISPGMYILKLRSATYSQSEKLIVQ